jgi:hypothetical protein
MVDVAGIETVIRVIQWRASRVATLLLFDTVNYVAILKAEVGDGHGGGQLPAEELLHTEFEVRDFILPWKPVWLEV